MKQEDLDKFREALDEMSDLLENGPKFRKSRGRMSTPEERERAARANLAIESPEIRYLKEIPVDQEFDIDPS